jgi:Fe2+ transport system protein FeoA
MPSLVMISNCKLSDLPAGAEAILEAIELPEEEARHLMVLGFLPGHRIEVGLSAPGGDPRVYRVDGSEVALRRETASHLETMPLVGRVLET